MKKFTFILLMYFITSACLAQSPVRKGVYSVSGNISYNSSTANNSSDSRTEFILNPSAGYFFIDNFYTGFSINYQSISFNGRSNSSYGFGPSLRYYFDADDKLKPYLGLSYLYSNIASDSDITSNLFTLSGGVDLFITSYFAIEGSVNYGYISYNFPSSYYPDDTTGKILNISVGANYFIN